MGIINEFGLNETMNKEQVSEQLFDVRKKLVTRQNSADVQKRSQAELQLDLVNSIQNAVDKMASTFPDVQLLIGTYGYSADNGKLNKELKEAIEAAASGDGNAAGNIADFLGNNGQGDLRNQWMFWAADCGAVQAYQVCGYLLTDSNPDEAIKWFEKADQAGAIGAANIYNWGLIYYRMKNYASAKEKFERAAGEGHAGAFYFLGEMYENGYGVEKNLENALEQYRLSKQKGLQEAQQGITRVANLLNQQADLNSTNNYSNANVVNNNSQNGQPTLVFKSDKKSSIPNLNDIKIDDLKDKVHVDEIKGKVEDFASKNNIDTEKVKSLPWKKIIIGAVILFVFISMIKGCTNKISSKHQGTVSDSESVVTEGSERQETNEKVALSEEEKALIGEYDGYYYTGSSNKRGLTLSFYEDNGLKASYKFYPLVGGDDISEGEYLMDVVYSGDKYELTATEWVNQPGGYSTIDLTGVLEGDLFYGVTDDNYPFSVTINDGKNTVKECWLTDLEPVQKDDDVYVENYKIGSANTGDEYVHYMLSRSPYSEIIYKLNGDYDTLKGVWSICYSGRDDEGENAFEIYADDKLVYTSESIKSGSLQSEVSANIEYCDYLRIRFKEGKGVGEFGNIKLSSSTERAVSDEKTDDIVLPCWLTDIDYLTSDNVTVRANDVGATNTGSIYSHYISGREGSSIEYYLRGEYNSLSGLWAICFNDRDVDYSSYFEIYADDELVYTAPELTGGDMPVDVDVDIKNCEKLRIVFPEGNGAAEFSNIYLMNKGQ